MAIKSQIYFLYGNDSYRLAQAARTIETRFSGQKDSLADLVKLDLVEANLESLKQTILTMPFLVSHRLFILRSIFSAPKATQEALPKLLEQVSSSTIVVLVHNGLPDKRLGLYKWLLSQTKAQEFAIPSPEELKRWVTSLTQKENLTLEPKAMLMLVDSFKDDTNRLFLEISKLMCYAKARNKSDITTQDIALLCQLLSETSVFELTDAIRDGNTAKALRMARQLLEQEDPLMLSGALGSQIRTLAKLVLCRNLGIAGASQLASVTKLNPYVVKLALPAATALSPKAIKKSYDELVWFDSSVKNGSVPADLGLSLLIIRLCNALKPNREAGRR